MGAMFCNRKSRRNGPPRAPAPRVNGAVRPNRWADTCTIESTGGSERRFEAG
jgi:hypothetical protein